METFDRSMSLGPGGGDPGIGGVRICPRGVIVDRAPRIQGMVLAVGDLEVGVGDLAGRDLAAPEQRRKLVGAEPREVRHSRPRIAGTTM
jgi:hypothetical protein